MMNEGTTKITSTEQTDPMFQSNVSNMTRYMRFVGIYQIIIGVIYCFGIITAIIGVPVIIMGSRLKDAANSFDKFARTKSFPDISKAIEKQTRSLFILYVLLIIGLVFMAIYIFVLISIGLSHL